MESDGGSAACGSLQVALHVQGDAAADRLTGPYAIDRLLHLAVTAVSAFDRIGCGGQQ